MNYSANLPQLTYPTTIGDLKIADLTSYYTIDDTGVEPDTLNVSQNTTLIELANSAYSDVNQFWLFMYSNKTTNPFLLTNEDTSDLLEQYSVNKVLSAITATSDKITIPAGSLIFRNISNSGSTWDYGYTGNYGLTSGFALVDTFNNFSKEAITNPSTKGITLGVSDNLVFLIKGTTSYYYYANNTVGFTNTIQAIQAQETATQKIIYKNANLQVYGELEEGPITGGSSGTLSGSTQAISYSEVAQTQSNLIKVYSTDQISKLNITKVIQNYIP